MKSSQVNEIKTDIKLTKSRGRGVFAKKNIKKDEVIETCQIIKFSLADAEKIEQTYLSNYWFSWLTDEKPDEYGAFCLGNGALYNHSTRPNAHFHKDFENNLIHFKALLDISAGTEITVKYGTVWFEEKEEN